MTPSLLILTDFFRAATQALDYATSLAEPLRARLVLLHVHRDSILDPEMFTGELSALSKEATALALGRVFQPVCEQANTRLAEVTDTFGNSSQQRQQGTFE